MPTKDIVVTLTEDQVKRIVDALLISAGIDDVHPDWAHDNQILADELVRTLIDRKLPLR